MQENSASARNCHVVLYIIFCPGKPIWQRKSRVWQRKSRGLAKEKPGSPKLPAEFVECRAVCSASSEKTEMHITGITPCCRRDLIISATRITFVQKRFCVRNVLTTSASQKLRDQKIIAQVRVANRMLSQETCVIRAPGK